MHIVNEITNYIQRNHNPHNGAHKTGYWHHIYDLSADDYVAVVYDKDWYVGLVKVKKKGMAYSKYLYFWPVCKDHFLICRVLHASLLKKSLWRIV